MVALVNQLGNRGIQISDKIRRALETTDRAEFMPNESTPYEDRP
jgi:protein-L-isoaspartate O-methyltransferase